ncbi:recombinase family protein [Mediterraneibacter gnavus]|uniref:recombinase family protein n=1 Tax=Mediterraneibacter gnavus TaxID=33038 RepID=UPI0036D2AF96
MKKKCYIYIRVSTAMQVDGYSLEAQKERLMKFAEFQEMEVVREYCDAGKSGKSITGRPEFQRMLQDVSEERDGVAFILVFKLSRFGRNAADVLNSLQFIQDYGVNLICVEDGIDSSKDSGKLTITVLSAVAEIERENILVQTMEGRKQKAREGKWNGGQAPFGYDLDSKNSTLVVNEEEAEIVRIIYDKFVHTDMGADAICNYLNQRGYTKKKVRGHELNYFARGLIMKILDNPVYTGKIAYGKNVTEKVKGTRDEYRRVKTDDYLLADGLHEAIVNEETWEAAREKRKRTGVRFVKTHSLEHEHILTGLIRCPLCGGGMSGTVQRRQNKKTGEYKDTFYYRCHHRKKVDGKICDYKPMLNQKVFNAEVEEFIRYMVAGDEFRSFVQEKLEEKVDVSALETEREQLQKQLKQVQGSKLKLIQMLDRLDTGDKHYTRKYQDMQDRLDNLYDKVAEFEETMKDIDAKIGASYGKEITGKKLYEFLLDFDILYDKMTDMEKKEFMNTFIEKIELKNETVNNGTGQGSRIEHIDLAFPVYYGDCKGTRIRMPEENTVETVVLLSQQKPDDTIEIDLDLDELDATSAETKATYQEIKDYVLKEFGLKVSNLYISQIKRKCGIEVGENYNLPKTENPKVPQCPKEKEEAIKAALKYFAMI